MGIWSQNAYWCIVYDMQEINYIPILSNAKLYTRCPLPSLCLSEDAFSPVHVSLFKVRWGRGAPYGDFLINNTSKCAVNSLLSWYFPCPKELLFSCTHDIWNRIWPKEQKVAAVSLEKCMAGSQEMFVHASSHKLVLAKNQNMPWDML